jgi:branched-chain amino acid transport system substrate-binding protein
MIRRLLLAATTAALTLSAPADAADPVRIGVALSQTGNLADSAAPYFKGLELWREQANAWWPGRSPDRVRRL